MNILDYIRWRGDLSFETAPINEVDILILSRLVYLPWDSIVPEGFDEEISLAEAVEQLGEGRKYLLPEDRELAKLVGENLRYRELRLCGFVNQLDLKLESQFCAITFLADENICVIFRGTDNTIVGWKEDLNMSFMPVVPGQTQAAEYLEKASVAQSGSIIVAGHSKGGNFAAFAAAFCQEWAQRRVERIYNFDGPGFCHERVEAEGYEKICDRLYSYIPQSSLIGMMLEQKGTEVTVRSNEFAVMQHDLYSWEILRDQLIRVEKVNVGSEWVDRTLKNWLEDLPADKRAKVIDAVFEILNATDKTTMSDISKNLPSSIIAMFKYWHTMENEEQQNIWDSARSLIRSAGENVGEFKEYFREMKWKQ